MAEENASLWAPWRMEYIRSLSPDAKDDGCFLCGYWGQPDSDQENRVVWRTSRCMVVLNRFPYTNGHLLVAPAEHVGELAALDDDTLIDMTRATRDAVGLLTDVLHPQGFNVGINLGRCAGAGLPGHVHTHIVPRWSGDTNYMAVIGDTRVVPQSLDDLHTQLTEQAAKSGLRS